MAGEWRKATVEEIAAPTRNALVGGPFGSNLVSRDYVADGVPVIRGQNMGSRWVSGEFAFVTDEKAKSLGANLARPGDIVFTQRGTLGQVSVVPEARFDRYLVSQSQMKLTVDRNVADPIFYYYVFTSAEQQDYIGQRAIQTGVPHTNLGILRTTPVPLPPLTEQCAIAHILGTLDDKIELNRRMSATLEALARALFKSWFVDFDPVRAKSEGRDPDLPPHLATLFPERFVESEMGEVPEGWEVATLSSLADLNPETWFRDSVPRTVRYVDLANTKWGSITSIAEYSWQEAPSRARRVLRPWDTIVGTVRPGNGSYALMMEKGLTGSTGFAVLRPREPQYRAVLYLAATSPENIERLTHLADGAAYPAVRPDAIPDNPIVSSPSVLEEFARIANPLLEKTSATERESRTLAALRDALLPKLVSGEIRVNHVEHLLDKHS